MRFLRKLRGILGILLILIGISGVFFWEKYGRESFLYLPVIVVAEDLQEGQPITLENIAIKNIDKNSLTGDYFEETDIENILGQITLVNLSKETILSSSFIEDKKLVPQDNESILKIPVDWIISFPSTIRRGDKLFVYPYKIKSNESGNFDTESLDFIEELVVVYAKDSGAKEVTAGRYEGERGVASFEVILSVDQLNNLKDWVGKGYRFIFSYQ